MIIFRYLAKDTLVSTLAVSFALMFIFVSARFVKYLAQAASGSMSGDILFAVILYRMPGFMELIIPLGFFVALLLSYGRLYVESEMIVMQSCGISKAKLLLYTQIPGFFIMMVVASLSMFLSPLGMEKFHGIWDDPKNFSGVGVMVPGRFQVYQKGRGVSYAGEVSENRTRMENIFLASSVRDKGAKNSGDEALKGDADGAATDKGISVVVANSGKVWLDQRNQSTYVELTDGYRFEGTPGQLDFRVTHFEKYGQLMDDSQSEPRPPASDAKPTRELLASSEPEDVAALHWRFSVALAVPILAFIALSLSETSHRRGRFIKLLPGVVLYILYVVGLSVFRGAIEKGQVPVLIGMWPVHALFLTIGFMLYYGDAIKHGFKRRKLEREVLAETLGGDQGGDQGGLK